MPALLAAFGRAPSRRPSPQAVPGSAFNLRMEFSGAWQGGRSVFPNRRCLGSPNTIIGGYPLICAQRVVACVFCHSRNWRNKASRSSDRADPRERAWFWLRNCSNLLRTSLVAIGVAVAVEPFLCRAENEPIPAKVR